MINSEIARIFEEMADILSIKGVEWKPQAYRKAARTIISLSKDLKQVYSEGGLKALDEIPSIGFGMAKKIEEFIKTGKIKEYEKLKKSIPRGVEEFMQIPGMGPKRALRLYSELKIRSVTELESAARKGRISKLAGFGKKSEQDILKGLGLVSISRARKLLGFALPVAREVQNNLRKLKFVKRVEIAGSIRRMKETVRDIDMLVISSEPSSVMQAFVSMPNVRRVLAKGPTKSSVILKEGLGCDARVIDDKSFGAALMYFTGSKDHNIRCRQLAIKKGYKLSEYGLFRGSRFFAGRTEQEVYTKLGMQFVPPELRENQGEISAALEKSIPKLIGYGHIKGDLQMHTKWSDGLHTPEEMVKEAIRMKYSYVGITDHSQRERIAHGMPAGKVSAYLKELSRLQKKYRSIKILKGAEVDILRNGKLDYSRALLEKFDIVAAAVHSGFKMSKKAMTDRIVSALSNEHVTYLAHPTGRLINRRNPYDVDMDMVFKAARDNSVWLEVDGLPSRLDLNDVHIKDAVDNRVKLVINSDSHSRDHLRFIELGIATARRGWAKKADIVNALPWNRFKRLLR